MTPLHALARRLWPLLDWRRHAVLEARGRRGAAAMLDESMRRTVATLRVTDDGWEVIDGDWSPMNGLVKVTVNGAHVAPYRLGDSDGTRLPEPADGEAVPPPTTRTVDRQTLLRRAREASQGGADYLPPWTGEGL